MRPESYAHVWDALQAVQALRRFTKGVSEEEYLSDLMLSSAVERQLEILGEALNRVRRGLFIGVFRVFKGGCVAK